jgi:hypothetical protein
MSTPQQCVDLEVATQQQATVKSPQRGTIQVSNVIDTRSQPWQKIVQDIKNAAASTGSKSDENDWFTFKKGYYYNHTS